jgi:hypothetical protein
VHAHRPRHLDHRLLLQLIAQMGALERSLPALGVQLRAVRLLPAFHLGLMDFPILRELARQPIFGGGHLVAQPVGGFCGPPIRLTLNVHGLPHEDQDGRQHEGAEEPIRLRTGVAGSAQDEPRDRQAARGATGQPADSAPTVDRSEQPAVLAAQGHRLGRGLYTVPRLTAL